MMGPGDGVGTVGVGVGASVGGSVGAGVGGSVGAGVGGSVGAGVSTLVGAGVAKGGAVSSRVAPAGRGAGALGKNKPHHE